MTFLDYYRENLVCLRTLSAEFAAEFPKIAARLALSPDECRDPYIERLLEGSAFLASRVEQKIEQGYPRLLESILNALAPAALYPTPAFAVLEVQPTYQDERIRKCLPLPAGSRFNATIPSISTPCTFSTLTDITLHPLVITEAEYCTRELSTRKITTPGVQAALILHVERADGGIISNLPLDELSLFLNLPEEDVSLLQEQLTVDLIDLQLSDGTTLIPVPHFSLDLPINTPLGTCFSSQSRLLEGLQTLQRFLAFPAAFKFLKLKGLSEALRQVKGKHVDLIFTLKRRTPNFINLLGRENFSLSAVLVENIFRHRSERSNFSGQYEYHLVPNRTAPLDYEVLQVLSSEIFNDHNATLFHCKAFYSQTGETEVSRNQNSFFSQHRRERLVHPERQTRSSYAGSEVFLSFAGKEWDHQWSDAAQFQAEMLCSNRDLPLLLHPNTKLIPPDHTPLDAASFIVSPSRPSAALIRSGTAEDWQKLSHIAFNLSSVLWQPGEIPLNALKSLIRSYAPPTSLDRVQKLIEAIVDLHAVPKTFRFIVEGCVFYETGWQIHLTLAEASCAGTGVFLFGSIIWALLRSYIPLNSWIELSLHTDHNPDCYTWKLQKD